MIATQGSRLETPVWEGPVQQSNHAAMGQIVDKIMGGDEGGGDAAVKRQAEGASNPMYQLANLIGEWIDTLPIQQSWALSVFLLIFSIKKMLFLHFL